MPHVDYPRTVEVVVHAQSEGSERANVFHFYLVAIGFPTATQLDTLCQNFWTAIGLAYRNCCGINVNFTAVTARDLQSVAGAVGTYAIPQPAPGTINADLMPANCAAVISWRTGLSGRSARGRSYIFGLQDGAAIGSTLTNAQIALLTALSNAIGSFTNAGGVGVLFSILSKTLVNTFPVRNAIIDAIMDSQRRRLPGRGN